MRMQSRRVYRIEHSILNVGPYALPSDEGSQDVKEMWKKHSSDQVNRPILNNDIIVRCTAVCDGLYQALQLVECNNWVFGFNSMSQLRAWFTDEELKILHNNGFNLVLYSSSNKDSVSFKKQVIFDKEKAELEFKQNLISLIRS